MVHATKFLLRWLYLNNLIYDRAEIQSLPFLHPSQIDPATNNINENNQRYHNHHHHDPITQQQQHHLQVQYPNTIGTSFRERQEQVQQYQRQSYSDISQHHPNPIQRGQQTNQQQQQKQSSKIIGNDYEWKRKALHKIAQYPPGSSRLLVLDSLRLEIVHELARQLGCADGIMHAYKRKCQLGKRSHFIENGNNDDSNKSSKIIETLDLGDDNNVDKTIAREFEKATSSQIYDKNDDTQNAIMTESDHSSTISQTKPVLDLELKEALELQRETRDYLPQFVSALLHSPPSLTTNQLDPLSTLRDLLMNRCVRDPNLGIELCWLLEAEVGRAWKKLFEHRQQTGKRLILVLPADKAVVIAKIGSEKKTAFDLLQDVECATAYGHYGTDGEMMHHHSQEYANYYHGQNVGSTHHHHQHRPPSSSDISTPPRLPASLSMKRCSHFGDTMNFIDHLTQISLKLMRIPDHARTHHLKESLEELNRRLRRRMATEGNVSLDVEDNLGPNDWPSVVDISVDASKHSVHLPLEPTATTWPGKHGDENFCNSSPLLALKTEQGVMRVVNIVSSKCRLLASRERCPFLVHCEVLETGLEGRDARLYTNREDDIGTTVQEVLGVAAERKDTQDRSFHIKFPPYQIPSEISADDSLSNPQGAMTQSKETHPRKKVKTDISTDHNTVRLRGGDQEDYSYPNMYDSGYQSFSHYESIQEEQLQRLHEHLQSHQQHPHYAPRPPSMQYLSGGRPELATYSALLNRVFGNPWTQTCEEIRKTSPYGNAKGWRLASFIMKAGEDIRREALVMQVISKMKIWFEQDIPECNRPYLKPYTILCVGGDAGLLECIRDAKSIDEVKKNADGFTTLREYFERAYGAPIMKGKGAHTMHHGGGTSFAPHQQQYTQHHSHHHPNLHQTIHQMQQQSHHYTHQQYTQQPRTQQPHTQQQQPHKQHTHAQQPHAQQPHAQQPHAQQQPPPPTSPNTATQNVISQTTISFEKAQDNFLRSLVGNSLICYILQIKDRHNANILLDREGHIMHIDFGFVLGDTPKMGKVPLFSERAPFKLTGEFWDVIGGWNYSNGGLGVKFCKMFEEAFYCASMHSDELVTLIESAILNLTQNANVAQLVANGVRNRLRMRGERNSVQQKTFIMDLVNTALTSWGTSTYDWLQKSMNGYI